MCCPRSRPKLIFKNLSLPWCLAELRLEVPKARTSAGHERRQIPETKENQAKYGVSYAWHLIPPPDPRSLFQCARDDVVNGN